MTKTNDTWRVAALEDHGTLVDSELDALSGGWLTGLPGYSGPQPVEPHWNHLKLGDIELK